MSKVHKKLEQLRALQKHKDKNLQYVVREACQIFGSPLILYDIDFNILEYADNVTNDGSFWNWFVSNGKIKQEIQDAYVSEGLSDIIVSSQRSVFLSSDKLRHDCIWGKIYDKGRMPVACVHVVSSNHSVIDDDLVAVDALRKMLSHEILKIPHYQNYAQRKLDTCITMLIGREIEDAKAKLYIAGYVEMVYKGLKDNLYLAVADIARCDPAYSKLVFYRDLFKQTRPAFKYSIYSNYIIIIMSADEGIFYPRKSFGRLNKLFEQDHIKVGVSRRFENFFELSRYYKEAVKALHDGLETGSEQLIFTYNDGLSH